MPPTYEELKRDHGRKHAIVYELIEEALQTDGEKHKQWYLQEIAHTMGWNLGHLDDHIERGIAP